MEKLTSTNPTTLEEVKTYKIHSSEEISVILSDVQKTQKVWSELEISFRSSCLEQLSGILKDRAREYAKLIALEMGKPVSQGIIEV